jgi:hypothetical protein
LQLFFVLFLQVGLFYTRRARMTPSIRDKFGSPTWPWGGGMVYAAIFHLVARVSLIPDPRNFQIFPRHDFSHWHRYSGSTSKPGEGWGGEDRRLRGVPADDTEQLSFILIYSDLKTLVLKKSLIWTPAYTPTDRLTSWGVL